MPATDSCADATGVFPSTESNTFPVSDLRVTACTYDTMAGACSDHRLDSWLASGHFHSFTSTVTSMVCVLM